jgi:DNA-binding HxlR family transcriptional regulator
MKRKCLHASPCPIARALDSIGDWWTLLILRDACKGYTRFNAIQKNLGIPRNILTARLRMLVEHDILAIVPASDGSVYREYVLTQKGQDLIPVLLALGQWGERHLPTVGQDGEAACGLEPLPESDGVSRAGRDAMGDAMDEAVSPATRNGREAGPRRHAAGSAGELRNSLKEASMPSSAVHAEGGRFIGPMQPRAGY